MKFTILPRHWYDPFIFLLRLVVALFIGGLIEFLLALGFDLHVPYPSVLQLVHFIVIVVVTYVVVFYLVWQIPARRESSNNYHQRLSD